jgi:hypothetical protein
MMLWWNIFYLFQKLWRKEQVGRFGESSARNRAEKGRKRETDIEGVE